MPSGNSNPETEPIWRADDRLDQVLTIVDQVLTIVRHLEELADRPPPIAVAAGQRLVLFPWLRRDPQAPPLIYQSQHFGISSNPMEPLTLEVMSRGNNVLGLRFQLAGQYGQLIDFEICGG